MWRSLIAIDNGCFILNSPESAPIMSKLMSKCAWSGSAAVSALAPPIDYRVSRKQYAKVHPHSRIRNVLANRAGGPVNKG